MVVAYILWVDSVWIVVVVYLSVGWGCFGDLLGCWLFAIVTCGLLLITCYVLLCLVFDLLVGCLL